MSAPTFLLVFSIGFTQQLLSQPTDVPQTCNLTPNPHFSTAKSVFAARMLALGFPKNPTDNQILCVLNTPAAGRRAKVSEIADFVVSSSLPPAPTMVPPAQGQTPSVSTPPPTITANPPAVPQPHKILSTIPYARGFTAYNVPSAAAIYMPESEALKTQLIWNNPNSQCQNGPQGITLHTQPRDITKQNLYYVTCRDRSGCKVIVVDPDDCQSQILGHYSVKEALSDNIPVGGRNQNLMLLNFGNLWSNFMLNNDVIQIDNNSLKNNFGFTLPQQINLFLDMLKAQGNAAGVNNLNLGCKTGASCLLQKAKSSSIYTANGSFTLNMADNQLSFLPFVRIPANSKFDIIYNKNLFGAATPSSIDQYTTNISDGILAGKEIIFRLQGLKERRTLVCTDPVGCDFSCITTSSKVPLGQCGQKGTHIFVSRGTYRLEMSQPPVAPIQPIMSLANQASISLKYSRIARDDLFAAGNEEEFIEATYNGKKVILRASLCLNYPDIKATIAAGVKFTDFSITCKEDKGCTLKGLIPEIPGRTLDIPLILNGRYIVGSPLATIEQPASQPNKIIVQSAGIIAGSDYVIKD